VERDKGIHLFSSSFLRDKGHLQALKFKHPPLFVLLALERKERLGAIEDATLFTFYTRSALQIQEMIQGFISILILIAFP
jgi:hypothetical protein